MIWMLALVACQGPRGRCGEGTVKLEGACVVEGQPTICGSGTQEVDGVCESVDVVTIDQIEMALPFEAGETVEISQGFHGTFSHSAAQTWAVDFVAAEGTPITAARGGLVVDVKEDSDEGCGDPACAPLTNYIRIDHGDGTISEYLHLEQDGADVEPGDMIATGELIGRTGNTGWSTGPHLHLHVMGTDGRTLPLTFPAFDGVSDGSPYISGTAVSANTPQAVPDPVEPSRCQASTFSARGVAIGPGFPCSVALLDEVYPLTATLAPGLDLLVHRYALDAGEWQPLCLTPDASGEVQTDITFSSADHGSYTYLQLSAVPGGTGCSLWPGWEASPRITLRDTPL